jgi:transposase
MAAGKKNAARRGASIAFLDESGLLMAPLVRRTWAPQGETPVLPQRTRSREKVSMVAVVSLSPRRRRVGLYWALHPNANINAPLLVEFLNSLTRHLRGPLVLVWDRLATHRARPVQEFLRRHPRVRTVFLPAYAPELNPPEYFWGYLKRHPLANLAPADAHQLERCAARHTRRIARQQPLLRSFIRASHLPLRLS